MYNTSQNYKNYIKEPSRMFESKIILGSRTLNNDDVIQLKTELQQPSNGFTLGSCISKSLELTLNNDGGAYASVGIVNVSLGLKMGELIEYIPQGIFNIDKVEKTDYTVKVTAYDNMIKFETAYSEKYDNPTLKQVIQQLQDITGVEFDSSVTIPSYTLNKLSGYTCREILGYVASLMGGNAYITREGKLTIVTPVEVDYTVTSNNYWDYDLEDNTYKIGMITCQNKLKNDAVDESDDYEAIEEKNTISAGSLGTDNMELTFINPWMTDTILNTVYNKLKSFSFLGYSMKWQGDLSLDVGNIINVIDKHGVTRKAFMFSDKINYNGGLTQETGAKGQTKSSNQFSTVDSPTELDRISVKVLLAEKAIIQKANIADLTAVSAKVGTLDVSIATINTALINKANIDDLNATNANVTNLNAQYANLSNAIINKADIADLNATNANISNLKATVADISTLVSGNLTSANIHSLVLTADKVTVQNGFIKNAMVESLVADKITSGTLNTNKLTISSNDGGLVMSNSTIQFSDKDKNVRVQIGQDAKGDFNFIVKGTDGRTVLLDSTGLHEGAISDGLIKTDMIADNAINSNKIDYSSVISGLNADGSNYINASKVAIDLTGQTLDIAFNSIKSTADSANDKIDNLNVGGRNLITNSSFLYDKLPSTANFSMLTVNNVYFYEFTKNGYHYKATATNGAANSSRGIKINLNNLGFSVGDTITISNDIKGTFGSLNNGLTVMCASSTNNTFYAFISSGTPHNTNISDWKRVSRSYTIPSNIRIETDGSFYLYIFFGGGTGSEVDAYVRNVKVEKGNIVTDWTPAPEDIDSSISDIKNITETNTTSISAIQGQISTLISNTTVTVDGKEKTLKDAYSGTVQTVNSINTTIGEHTSTINTLNGTVSSNSSKITSIQTDLNGIKTSVSSVQSDLNSTKSQLSSLSTTLDGFESRVETTESNLSNLNVGGRNVLYNSGDFVDLSHWGSYGNIFYASISQNELTITRKGNDSSIHLTQDMTIDLENGQIYTLSIYAKSNLIMNFNPGLKRVSDQSCVQFSNPIGSFDFVVSGRYENHSITFTHTLASGRYMLWWSSTGRPEFIVNIKNIKLEKGNIATDWTPAPEDVQDYTDTQISSAKTEIKQTTDSISQSVLSINSNITTINNTLGNKAEKSTVESISNSVTSLNTTLNGITGRVSSLETNTTTLTTKLNDLSVGGRNLLLNSDFENSVNNWSSSHNASKIIITDFSSIGTFPIDVKRCIKITSAINQSYGYIVPYKGNYFGLESEQKYTISFYIFVPSSNIGNAEVRIYYDNSGWNGGSYFCVISERDKWVRKSLTFISDKTYASKTILAIGLRNTPSSGGDIAYIANPKLELGNILTDWTPAPEDIDNSITTVQETVTSNTTEISALKNSISLKVDSTTLNSYKDTVNGQINTINSSISSMQSSIDLNTSAITSKVSANDVGTIITQNPTSVMTAFNKISNYFQVSSDGAKFGNIATGDYMAFNDRGLVRYIANQEKRYIYMVQQRTFEKTLDNQTPSLTSAQLNVGKTNNWDDISNNIPKAKDYAQTFTLYFDNELVSLLAGYAPNNQVPLEIFTSNPSNLSYSGISSGSQNGVVGEDYVSSVYTEIISMTPTSITFKAARICCVYEVTVDKLGLIKYYQFKRNYAGGKMTWKGLLFA